MAENDSEVPPMLAIQQGAIAASFMVLLCPRAIEQVVGILRG